MISMCVVAEALSAFLGIEVAPGGPAQIPFRLGSMRLALARGPATVDAAVTDALDCKTNFINRLLVYRYCGDL